ncbi:MAG: acetate/propionate family kinase [Spirochaetales bacterium]|nr:acetate/propionate family kinase [Spirochaetales bacterium]
MSSIKHVICFNGGSSSIKVSIKKVEGSEVSTVVDFNCQGLGTDKGYIDVKRDGKKEVLERAMKDHGTALKEITGIINERFPELTLDAAGHRVVHGGSAFTDTALIDGADGEVQQSIHKFASLAPLHNPANHHIIAACFMDPVFSKIPHAAIFDTQFHAKMPDYAKYYAVPEEWREKYGIQRYGFHGASYAYITGRFAELNNMDIDNVNIVIAHLGNGCSMAKVVNGKGADTSMGTTPLEGLVMGTRSGDVDPGALELMSDNLGVDIKEIVRILNKESGLYGLYNKDEIKEMHFIRQAAMEGDEKAEKVVDVAAYRAAKYFCDYLGTMEKPDGVVFTGGIGENEGYFRRKVLNFMSLFNWKIDDATMDLRSEEAVIAESGLVPGLKAWIIPTDEEKIFALEAAKFIK